MKSLYEGCVQSGQDNTVQYNFTYSLEGLDIWVDSDGVRLRRGSL